MGGMHLESLWEYTNTGEIPEHRLLRSILKGAILDYLSDGTGMSSTSSNIERDKRNAKIWLFFEPVEDDSAPFSFGWVCQHLSRDYKYLSKEIRRALREAQKSKDFHLPSSLLTHQ